MNKKEMIEKKLKNIVKEISQYCNTVDSKKKTFEIFFQKEYNNVFTCEAVEGRIKFDFSDVCSIMVFPNDEEKIYITSNQRQYADLFDYNIINYLNFYQTLINSEAGQKIITRIREFWNDLSNYGEKSKINLLYDEKNFLEKQLKRIEQQEEAEQRSVETYYIVQSSFYIANNKKKYSYSRGRWHSRNPKERLLSNSVIKLDSVSKRKANFDVTCLIEKKIKKFTKIHTKFLGYLIDRNYIKPLPIEDAMEKAMELFN